MPAQKNGVLYVRKNTIQKEYNLSKEKIMKAAGAEEGQKSSEEMVEEKTPAPPSLASEGPHLFAGGGRSRAQSQKTMEDIIDHLRQKQFDPLMHALRNLSEEDIAAFFSKKGHLILSWALNEESSQPLQFLTSEQSRVPKEILQTALKQRNFAIFSTYLYTQAAIQSEEYTPACDTLQIEKFKILLNLDKENIEDFMEDNKNKPSLLTEITQKNFRQAQNMQENAAAEEETPSSQLSSCG